MPSRELPHFPRGFLVATTDVTPPPSFVKGPILPHFYVHPWTNLEVAGDREEFVIVLGHCVPTWTTGHHEAANELLEALRYGNEHFFNLLSKYSGRHAIIFGHAASPNIVNDATGMRSVFYAGQGGVVSSHALLVERALGGEIYADSLPYQYGYPGNRTPYVRTKLLTPNTYYSMADNTVRRFWPFRDLTSRAVDDVAEEILGAATTALQNMSKNRSVKMALTAGLDSRVILAVGLNSGIDFETYTYGDASNTALDRGFASDLAKKFGVTHSMIPKPALSATANRRLSEVTYAPHHKHVTGGLIEWFGDPSSVAVTGNLLEIGRSFYISRRKEGLATPTTAPAMADLHYKSMSVNTRKILDQYGLERYFDIARLAFQNFIEDTELSRSESRLDGFDQFYWEHRMAAWHGPAMAERDFYAEAFIPFNSRDIFAATLTIPRQHRDTSSVFFRLIELVDPDLLALPINPKNWPLETDLTG